MEKLNDSGVNNKNKQGSRSENDGSKNVSIEKIGIDKEHIKKAQEHRNERYEKIIEKAKKSEYWDKPLPGIKDWTVGQHIEEMFLDTGEISEYAPERVYRDFEEYVINGAISLSPEEKHEFEHNREKEEIYLKLESDKKTEYYSEDLEKGCEALKEYLEKQKHTYANASIKLVARWGTDNDFTDLNFYDEKESRLLSTIEIDGFVPDNKSWYMSRNEFKDSTAISIGLSSALRNLLKEYDVKIDIKWDR